MGIFNPSRLSIARKRRGFTKTALAEATEISLRSITAFEAGEKHPSLNALNKLADALEFPMRFFDGPDLDEPPVDGVSFRALSTLTARQRDQAIGAASLALDLAQWIDERFVLPAPAVPDLFDTDPETAAAEVRRVWGLGERLIGNSVHLLEAHGVRVFSMAEECAGVDAFSFWLNGVPYVFLNTLKTAEHGRMDVAHELGHLVLHPPGHNPIQGREAEDEAKLFARAFLMPPGSVVAAGLRNARLDHLIDAKRRWNTSLAALVYRLHELRLLSDWHYRTLFVEIGRRGYRTKEPSGIHRETSQVLAKVLRSLRSAGMAKADIANALSLPLPELNSLVFGLVLTVTASGSRDGQANRPLLQVVP